MNDSALRLAFVGMHPERRRRLVEVHGSAAGVLRRISNGTIRVPDHARAAADVPASRRIAQLDAAGIGVLGKSDLPPHLSELPDSPDVLFVKGILPRRQGLAVVGTRRATSYGLRLAESFGAVLAEAGVPVISGLAKGIDGAAHRGAVAAGGSTVAVLGCGADRWYPKSHRSLGERILDSGGAVLSEYPPGTPPTGWRFPPRNRIISGLAAAVVVVEARASGGALITARTGLEQGREILAVPGDVDRAGSVGCNLLIRDGAIPVLGPEDLLATVSLLADFDLQGAPEPTRDRLEQLVGEVGRDVDWLAMQTGLPLPEVLAWISRLEAAGRIEWQDGVVVSRVVDPA